MRFDRGITVIRGKRIVVVSRILLILLVVNHRAILILLVVTHRALRPQARGQLRSRTRCCSARSSTGSSRRASRSRRGASPRARSAPRAPRTTSQATLAVRSSASGHLRTRARLCALHETEQKAAEQFLILSSRRWSSVVLDNVVLPNVFIYGLRCAAGGTTRRAPRTATATLSQIRRSACLPSRSRSPPLPY